jgi:DNA modification methylase
MPTKKASSAAVWKGAEQLRPLLVKIDSIVLDERNARKHPEENRAQVARSLERYGQLIPIVVDHRTKVVLAGNCRVEEARKIGWDSIACVLVKQSAEDAKAFSLMDNRSAELASWDQEQLLALLLEIQAEEGIEVEDAGFTEEDIKRLQALMPSDEEDPETPEPPTNPCSVTGDVWICGRHRVMCGSSTVATDVEKLLAGSTPELMVTDPPYGVEYDPAWRNKVGASKTQRTGKVLNDDEADWTEAWSLFPGSVAYVWHAARFCTTVAASLESCEFETRAQLIWRKPKFALSRGHYHWQHEPCWYCVKKGRGASWVGDRKQSTIWDIEVTSDGQKTVHGTQKPIECMARPMRNHGFDLIYDPFLGSGSTLIAAERLGRTCFGMELNPAYVDVIVRRWEEVTEKKATNEQSGSEFVWNE